MPDVHLEYLALHLDRTNENPDLILGELLWVGGRQVFEFLRHGGMLIGSQLQL
jgi:hypothetical protein